MKIKNLENQQKELIEIIFETNSKAVKEYCARELVRITNKISKKRKEQ